MHDHSPFFRQDLPRSGHQLFPVRHLLPHRLRVCLPHCRALLWLCRILMRRKEVACRWQPNLQADSVRDFLCVNMIYMYVREHYSMGIGHLTINLLYKKYILKLSRLVFVYDEEHRYVIRRSWNPNL
jgi:hypothetical protein